MATEMLSPGVKVTIMDFSDYVTDSSATVLGIIGGARKGPVGPVYLSTREQALRVFGTPSKKDFGMYALLAALENSDRVYYNRLVPEDRKATAGNELLNKVLFQTKDYTNEFNGAKIEITKPDWSDPWLSGTVDTEHPEDFVGSDENIAKYGVDLSEVASSNNSELKSKYFNVVFTTPGGINETYKFCSVDTIVDILESDSSYIEAIINDDPSTNIAYRDTFVLSGGSIGASYAQSEEVKGVIFSSKSFDSTMNGWQVKFSNVTFLNTVDYFLTDVNGNIVESFTDLVCSPNDDRYFENFINTNSNYVNCSYDSEENTTDDINFISNLSFTLSGGTDGLDNITENDVLDALDDFSNPEVIEVDFITTPGWSSDKVIEKAIKICEKRQECMYLIDPPFGLSASQVVDWSNFSNNYYRNQGKYFDSSYAAIYWPWVQIYDDFSRSYMWMPPSGYVASQIAYSENISESWFAPAGINRGVMTSVVGIETSPSQDERDLLYGRSNCINPIINFQQMGVVIWGQKTTQRKATSLNRVNVRRLVNYLKKVVTASTYYFVFDPNDSSLWQKWVGRISVIFDNIKTRRGLYDYKIIMDQTTVTDEDIENSRMPGTIKFKPTKSAEYIPLDFMIMSYGASFDD